MTTKYDEVIQERIPNKYVRCDGCFDHTTGKRLHNTSWWYDADGNKLVRTMHGDYEYRVVPQGGVWRNIRRGVTYRFCPTPQIIQIRGKYFVEHDDGPVHPIFGGKR